MKILIKGKNGSVAVMYPVEGTDIEEAVQKFHDSHPDEYLDGYVEYDGELPNRLFRDAWVLSGKKIVVDSNKAKQIHMERIRTVRNRELERLDKEQLRYLADPWKPKELDAQKQILRDLPANIDLSNFDVDNPFWPDELGDHV